MASTTFSDQQGVITASWLNGVNFATYNRLLTGSGSYDPISLVDGAGTTTTVNTSGAEIGDFALASFTNSTQGIILHASVTSTNTVTVRLQNETGSTLDLASGTLAVLVIKQTPPA